MGVASLNSRAEPEAAIRHGDRKISLNRLETADAHLAIYQKLSLLKLLS